MESFIYLSAALGVGFIILATAYGVSQIGGKAVEATARQPEAADKIRTTALIIAALIEGAAMFGLIICLIIARK